MNHLTRRARGYAYQVFYRLPAPVRRRVARMVSPKYLVGAVTLIEDADAPRILLLLQPPGRGWGLPAGLLKKAEPPAVGAARELFEETGIRISPDVLTPGVPNAIVHARGWVDTIYRATIPAAEHPLTVDGGEVLEARWWPLNDLPRLTPNTAIVLGVYGIGPRATPPAAS